MVYSLDRDTPCPTLEKVTKEELQAIAARVETLGVPLLHSQRPDAMQILLSCAKTMSERSSVPTPRTTRPAYRNEAARLAAELATLPTDELARLLGVNRRIAAENRLRYGRFHGDDDTALPAIAAYTGIVSSASTRRVSPTPISNTPSGTSTSPRSSTGCSARWTPSAPTGSKAMPYCPDTATKRCFPIGKAG